MTTIHFIRDFDYTPDIFGVTYAFYAGTLHDDLGDAVTQAALNTGAAVEVPSAPPVTLDEPDGDV